MSAVDNKIISGFSKLSKRGKIKWIVENFFKDPDTVMHELMSYWHRNDDQQKLLDGFSENTISNFHLPYSVAPNFVINNKTYCIPMVIEESSVVAAASSAAKYWMTRGGFQAEVISTTKLGHIHFESTLDESILLKAFNLSKADCLDACADLTHNMKARGGGVFDVSLKTFKEEKNFYQIVMTFGTCESMGANFINTVLERYADAFRARIKNVHPEAYFQIIMCILSNYTPDCIVRVIVRSPIEQLDSGNCLSPEEFAYKFRKAVRIAEIDPYRATTHNKGIFNGIDAVVLATGNDFRAIESCGHTYASKDGQYTSLSHCTTDNGIFEFTLTIPMALGTVGGLTSLHPMAKRSLELLNNPTAEELMCIVASVGLAQNFAAIKSLVTTGIQEGHMRMHLSNILNQLSASEEEQLLAKAYFQSESVSHAKVHNYLSEIRSK